MVHNPFLPNYYYKINISKYFLHTWIYKVIHKLVEQTVEQKSPCLFLKCSYFCKENQQLLTLHSCTRQKLGA